MKTPTIYLKNISKAFGRKIAVSDVTFSINRGEILSLLGENGSGKTSLMNMLAGIYYPDSGEISINGKPVIISNPRDAFSFGIGMVHQHFKLVDTFTAAENIILGMKDKVSFSDACAKINSICAKYGFDINLNEKIYNMSVSQKQTVEIVKVLYRGADILILDEPTAVLTPQETDKLFVVLKNMREDNKTIILITHKLNEVEAISDRVVILRKGRYVGEMKTADTNAAELTDMMVGSSVSLNIERPEVVNSKQRLSVEGLNIRDEEGVLRIKNVSFSANSGEILGIAGISGSGQKELLEAIAGLQTVESGSIKFIEDEGEIKELKELSPAVINELGISLSFVPEDRFGMGLVTDMDITENMLLRSYRKSGFLLDKKPSAKLAKKVVEELSVDTPSISMTVGKLSGGNAQKVLIGREIATSPRLLMTAYAVRGIDVNSSHMIYDLLNEQKKNGCCVLFVGEDIDVLLGLCDRILVLCQGQVSGILDGRSCTKNQVGSYMLSVGGNQ